MKINKISLENFRLYNNKEVVFSNNVVIIVGENATGKSTIIEGIHLLITSRSFKNVKDFEMINKKSEQAIIKGTFESEKTQKNAIVLISKDFKKMSLNGEVFKKSSQYVGFCHVVSFSSADLFALQESPTSRRKMLDFMLAQMDKVYLETLKQYKNLLKEKNSLLKTTAELDNNKTLLLEVLNEQIYVLSQSIDKKRLNFIENINKSLKEINHMLSSNQEIAEIELKQSLPYGVSYSDYINLSKEDLKYRTSMYGPHRDDLIFKINNYEAIKVASQGQLKTMMISFKLAFARYLEEKNGENPIVLLDDVFGELDINRQNKILEFLKNGEQVIITTPSLSEIDTKILDKANIIKLDKEESV